MTINKAIELLQKDLDDPGSVDIMDLNEAQKLGIEALYRIQEIRRSQYTPTQALLPSETKE